MNRRLTIALLGLGLAACHRTPGPTAAAPANVADPSPGLFDGLFAGDATVVFEVTDVHGYVNDDGENTEDTSTSRVTCTRTVARVGGWRTARYQCVAADGDFPSVVREQVEGEFFSDGQRLWRNATDADLSDPAQPTRFSNWPDGPGATRPRSATVVIRKADGGLIGT